MSSLQAFPFENCLLVRFQTPDLGTSHRLIGRHPLMIIVYNECKDWHV